MKRLTKNKTAVYIGLILLSFGLGYAARMIFDPAIPVPSRNVVVREDGQYKLITPLLVCDISENTEYAGYQAFEEKIQKLRNNSVRAGNIQSMSVYFRKLNTARWMGVNEDEKYSPASLLKVPTMLAYLKLADANPKYLNTVIEYDGSFDDNRAEYFKPVKTILPHRRYTVDELLTYMIVYSDNNAARLLDQHIDLDARKKIYADLGVAIPFNMTSGEIDFMSAKTYSYFFRILYNSTYVNRVLSEKALNTLTQTRFDNGMRSVIPKEVLIASKFGERSVYTPANTLLFNELHECGVVYYPENPYLICVMTKGKDFEKLAEVIRDVNALVLQEVKLAAASQ